MQRRLQALARGRSRKRALRAVEGADNNALFILPTTVSALQFARHLCEARACRVTIGPVALEPRWGLGTYLKTPAEIVREFAGERQLATPVISFPDQLAGEGDSFVTLRFLGVERRFSLLEAVLVLRHQPRVHQFRSCAPFGAYRLEPVAYGDALSAADHRTAPLRLMRTLLSGLEQELARPPADWLGATTFALKSPIAFEFRVREELREVESILRLAVSARRDRRAQLQPALASVTALVRGRRS
ncbi:MAG: hypothetical protein ACRETU_05050 [Steroidobacterales bacterium]